MHPKRQKWYKMYLSFDLEGKRREKISDESFLRPQSLLNLVVMNIKLQLAIRTIIRETENIADPNQ
jgi:hypothetical protein